MPRMTGQLLDITHHSGDRRDPETGRTIGTYSYDNMHVLEGLEVQVIRVGDSFPQPLPTPGTEVDLQVRAYAYSSRREGIKIAWTAEGPYVPVHARASNGRRSAASVTTE